MEPKQISQTGHRINASLNPSLSPSDHTVKRRPKIRSVKDLVSANTHKYCSSEFRKRIMQGLAFEYAP